MPPSDDSSSSGEISFDSTPATTNHEPKSKTTDPLTHAMIICALEESVPFVLGYSGLGKEQVKRTRRYYVRKEGQGLSTFLKDIAPSDGGSLFKAVYSSGAMQRTLQCNGAEVTSSSVDETTMNALAECYRAADSWETRRQILSIMADKLTLNQLRH